LSYSRIETVNDNEEIEHRAINKVLSYLNIKDGVEISHVADIPGKSGMGSSSSFVVGLLNALHTMKHKMASKRELATEAIYIEQKVLNERVGSQDQVWAAHGGFNVIRFGSKYGLGEYAIQPLFVSQDFETELMDSMILVYTGIERYSSHIAETCFKDVSKIEDNLKLNLEIAEEGLEAVKNQDIIQIGRLLDKSWNLKKRLSNDVSNNEIDTIYKIAQEAGAIGGKILGAGGGGFILLVAEKENVPHIKKKLSNLVQVPFNIDYEGSKVLYVER
jgi:D-glycero-alpha-D-manno-heptose-7-phosphate kinase